MDLPVLAMLVVGAVLLVAVVALAVALVRTRVRTAQALAAAQAEAEVLAAQVAEIERRLARPAVRADDTEYVVTMLGRDEVDDPDDGAEPAPVVPAPLFADLVLREGAVQAASLAAGLRRALAPEVRHRIRFEMKREVKRARKQRRADLRQAKREHDERQRVTRDAA